MRRHVVFGRVATAVASIATFVGIQASAPPVSAVTAQVAHRGSPATHYAKLTAATGEQRVTPKITTAHIAPRAVSSTGTASPLAAAAGVRSTSTDVLMPGMLTVTDPTQPGTIDRPAMTYDTTSTQNVDVEFGGCVDQFSASCTTWSPATWTFNGTAWTKLSPSTSPSGRTEATLTYDPATKSAVLFGGENATGALSDTWTWNGTTWSQYTGSVHPSARYGATAAYLPATGLVYLFGGASSSTSFLADTWTWNGTTWSQLSPSTSPSARAFAAMAYAGTLGGTAGDLVLYGGKTASGVGTDTWKFDGTTWSEVANGPRPLENDALAYDPTLHVAVLFGGDGANGTVGALWAWNGTKWLESASAYYTAITSAAFAQDPANGQMVINGGSFSTATWTGNAATYELDYYNAKPSSNTLLTHSLSRQLTEVVNPVDTKLHLDFSDLSVTGGTIPLKLGQTYQLTDGCVSEYLGCTTTAGLLDVSALAQPDGSSVVLLMPDGSLTYCPTTGTGWACPGGSTLSYDGTSITDGRLGLTYDLNTNGMLASVTDRNGNAITLHYTTPTHPDHATSITDDEGRTTTLAYTTRTYVYLLSSITDPLGRSVTFGYDTTLGTSTVHTVAVSGPTSPTSTTTISTGTLGGQFGLFVTTPAGRESAYALGTLYRVTSIVRVTNTTTVTGPTTELTSYDHSAQVTVKDPDGHTTTYTLSGHQVTKVTDALGHAEQMSYNPDARPTTLTNNLTEQTSLAWSANDNLTSLTAPATGTDTPLSAAYSYTTPTTGTAAVKYGQYLPSSYTTGQDNCTAYGYDPSGNLTTTTTGLVPSTPTGGSPKGNCSGTNTTSTTTNAYQGDGSTTCGGMTGELCSTTTPAGGVTSYHYTQGNPTSVTEASGSCATGSRKLCTTYTYNADGEVATVTDGKGQTTTYTYNQLGQVTQLLYGGATSCTLSSGRCVQFTYDTDGNVTARADKTGTTHYVYDALGRLVQEELPSGANACSGTSPGAITYGYDAASNLTSYCDTGGTVTYAYDAANRMTGVATGSGSCTPGAIVQPCTQYGYNTLNELTSVTYPTSTGWTAAMTYSAAGNETGVTYKDGSTTEEALTYAYHQGTNDVPLVQSATDSSTGVTTTYTYDAENRLLKATTGTASTTDSYAYTADGNLTSIDLGGTSTTMAYNPANELCWALSGTSSNGCSSAPTGATTYTYDANGNQTANSAGEAIGYNPLNQTTALKPAGGTTESFAYTGVDSTQRTQAGTATFTNNEFGVATRTTGSTTAYFTYLPEGKTGRVQSMKVGSARYYYLFDGIGNVIGLINGSGTRVATYAYSPYGTTTASTGTQASTNPFRYEAGYTDATGFLHFGARYLDPQLGTWTQQDPASVSASYSYAGDDPVNRVDSSGFTTTTALEAGLAIAGVGIGVALTSGVLLAGLGGILGIADALGLGADLISPVAIGGLIGGGALSFVGSAISTIAAITVTITI